jgi:peptidoglycan/xylan/chitin deacetylase (PgdA/CDA1 family)
MALVVEYSREMSRVVPILLYHSIAEDVPPTFREWAVSPAVFADQMISLFEHRYTPITVSQLTAAITGSNERLPDRPVVITFDDGFADFYTAALPILKRYGFPATLYIPTGLIGNTNHWLYQLSKRTMLTWDQIVEINESDIECGAHSHSHPQLDTLSHAAARREIFHSKEVLEQHLSRQISTFSYPHGYHSSTVCRLVQEAGYSSACAVKHAISATNDDHFALARIIIKAGLDSNEFSGLLSGDGLRVAPRREQLRTTGWRLWRRLSVILKRPTNSGT